MRPCSEKPNVHGIRGLILLDVSFDTLDGFVKGSQLFADFLRKQPRQMEGSDLVVCILELRGVHA